METFTETVTDTVGKLLAKFSKKGCQKSVRAVFVTVFVAVVGRVPLALVTFPHGHPLRRSDRQSRPRNVFGSPFGLHHRKRPAALCC